MDLIVSSGSGATSCISIRLHDACRFYEQFGFWPDIIDSSGQFDFYKLKNDQDLSNLVFGHYFKPLESDYINFDHGWQFGWYNELPIEKLNVLASKVCKKSDRINQRSIQFSEIMQGRSGVLYRGNDKVTEVPAVSYDTMYEMALQSGSGKWIIQTDEFEFFEFWKSKFPDSVRIDEIPMINKDSTKYVMPTNRSDFLVDFIAALIAISQTDKLLMTTGNTGLWACIFRGNIKNVYQAWGGHEGFKMHNP
jgi:hypothetical protein